MTAQFASVLACVALSTGPNIAPSDPDGMTLGQILERALERNPGLAAEQVAADALEAERRSTAGHFGPVLRAEASAMLWDSDNVYTFDTSGFEELFGMLGAPPGLTVPPMQVTVRDQVTAKLSVMLIQPLAQLYQITHGHRARAALAEAGALDATAKRRELELQLTRTFFGALGASEMLDSVAEAEKQIAAIELQTQRYIDQGLLSKDSLLKVQVQREELAKNRFAAEKGLALTRATLNMLMGRPLSSPLTLIAPDDTQTATSSVAVDALQDGAVTRRPELLAGRAKMRAAEAAHDAAIGKLFPELNLVAAYVRNEGMGDLMLKDEVFAGLMLTWNVWDWGSTFAEAEAAGLRAREAALRIRAAEEGLRLDVTQRYLELEEAKKSEAVAKAALALAEENLRLEQNYYDARQTTATDLLNAQTAALRARNDRTVATMQVGLARRALAIAAGSDLLDATAHQENHR
ncbi:TolC family protein [Myxococcota bacterium]|nr:TolC family protein [Myxococcota bacterium]